MPDLHGSVASLAPAPSFVQATAARIQEVLNSNSAKRNASRRRVQRLFKT